MDRCRLSAIMQKNEDNLWKNADKQGQAGMKKLQYKKVVCVVPRPASHPVRMGWSLMTTPNLFNHGLQEGLIPRHVGSEVI